MHIDVLERYWLIAVGAMLGAFMAALLASVLIFGIQLPSPVGRVDPQQLDKTDFAQTGLRDTGKGHYDMYIVAQMWRFDVGQKGSAPAEIHIPAGSEVTFYITSKDVTHGFIIEQHDVNLMLVPGQIARASTTFNHAGTYHIICHEYCGTGHQAMTATIIVG